MVGAAEGERAGQVAHDQYAAGTGNLDRRVAIHAFGVNPMTWPEFVRSLVPWAAPARVLDIGAGTGLHWQMPVPTGVQVVLTDLHASMCRALQQATPHVVAQCGAEDLPFADASFDGVLCLHVLYHVPDPHAAVVEMLRVLRRPGWLAIASNGPGHMRELDEIARRSGLPGVAAHHTNCSIAGVESLLDSLGLAHVRHRYDDELLAPAAPVIDYLESIGTPLDDEARRRVQAAIVDVADGEGRVRISKDTALVLAEVR